MKYINCKECNKTITECKFGNIKRKFCNSACFYKNWSKNPCYGKDNHMWKGNKVGYSSLHKWIYDNWGKADRCESKECRKISTRYEWANISGKYNRIRSDWVRLCHSCHQKRDKNIIKNTGKRILKVVNEKIVLF